MELTQLRIKSDVPRTGIVIDEPKRANGRTRFTMFWRHDDDGRERAQCFDAVLEDYLRRDAKSKVFGTEEEAKRYAGWTMPAEPVAAVPTVPTITHNQLGSMRRQLGKLVTASPAPLQVKPRVRGMSSHERRKAKGDR